MGCEGFNSSSFDEYYAQYTTTVICSGVVQSSVAECNLSIKQAEPVCAETCALWATSEESIMINKNLCSSIDGSKHYMDQIRSDFTVCSNPTNSLSSTCVDGSTNEPANCGFASNTVGFCSYCSSSSVNSTDACCITSNADSRCAGVSLPTTTTTLQPIVTTGAGAGANHGLSGGTIAGIVIGSVVGFAILIALAALLWICARRRQHSLSDASLNQPNPQRKGASPPMHQMEDPPTPTNHINMVPGGRVARMSALREIPSSSPAYSRTSAAVYGGAKYSDSSDSEAMGASPGAMSRRIPPVTGKRQGSLSSSSVMAGLESDSSPRSGTVGQYSSPEGVTSGQSEQLSCFRDYYSPDDMFPGDKVAALWAYSPRAGDEFELDRGEMLKVIGIWDDGWATGVRLPERAEDYDIRHHEQRDSGVSSGSQRPSPAPSGEIKAFPLGMRVSSAALAKDHRGQSTGGRGGRLSVRNTFLLSSEITP